MSTTLHPIIARCVDALNDPRKELREAAIDTLAETHAPGATEALFEALDHPTSSVASHALEHLSLWPTRLAELNWQSQDNEDRVERLAATPHGTSERAFGIYALRFVPPTTAIPLLRSIIGGDNSDLRDLALISLLRVPGLVALREAITFWNRVPDEAWGHKWAKCDQSEIDYVRQRAEHFLYFWDNVNPRVVSRRDPHGRLRPAEMNDLWLATALAMIDTWKAIPMSELATLAGELSADAGILAHLMLCIGLRLKRSNGDLSCDETTLKQTFEAWCDIQRFRSVAEPYVFLMAEAALGLADLGDTRAIEPLQQAMAWVGPVDDDEQKRWSGRGVLGFSDTTQAEQPSEKLWLSSALDSVRRLKRSQHSAYTSTRNLSTKAGSDESFPGTKDDSSALNKRRRD